MEAPLSPAAPTLPDWRRLADRGLVPVLLVRHGQTAWNVERRFLGASDVPLDAEGRVQAERLASRLAPLPLSAIYSSPLSRAWDTAARLAEGRSLDPLPVADLAELSQGVLEGRPGRALPEQYPDLLARWVEDPTHVRIPGGETLHECRQRALTALHALLAAHAPGPPVAVVSHKMVIAALICSTLDLPLRHVRLIGQNNTAVNLLGWRDGHLSLHLLNDDRHLAG